MQKALMWLPTGQIKRQKDQQFITRFIAEKNSALNLLSLLCYKL